MKPHQCKKQDGLKTVTFLFSTPVFTEIKVSIWRQNAHSQPFLPSSRWVTVPVPPLTSCHAVPTSRPVRSRFHARREPSPTHLTAQKSPGATPLPHIPPPHPGLPPAARWARTSGFAAPPRSLPRGWAKPRGPAPRRRGQPAPHSPCCAWAPGSGTRRRTRKEPRRSSEAACRVPAGSGRPGLTMPPAAPRAWRAGPGGPGRAGAASLPLRPAAADGRASAAAAARPLRPAQALPGSPLPAARPPRRAPRLWPCPRPAPPQLLRE